MYYYKKFSHKFFSEYLSLNLDNLFLNFTQNLKNLMDNKFVENILIEFDKSNNQLNELFRIQNELSESENDLMSLQIRFVHKFTLCLLCLPFSIQILIILFLKEPKRMNN